MIAGILPNSGIGLFGPRANKVYRLRMYHSGGMTLDGLTALRPDLFADYFELQFSNGLNIGTDQEAVAVTSTSTVTVLGMADLGVRQDIGYDICYQEDGDNYIDFILEVDHDTSVLEGLTVLAFGKGKSLYNPGGPGPTPFEEARYTDPAPANQLVTVRVGLSNDAQCCRVPSLTLGG